MIKSKTNAELDWLIKENKRMVEDTEEVMLSNICRVYKISSVQALEILKYFDKRIKPTSMIPRVWVEWIMDVGLLDANRRQKFLNKLSEEDRRKFEKLKVGREIKVRKRFINKPKEVQDKKLLEVYHNSLNRYLKERGY